jgi:SAM-dependent methyltransferase
MSYAIHHRDTCRICGSADVPFFLDLGSAPFTDDFVDASAAGTEFSAPLKVAFCRGCHTAQTRHDVEVGEYYRDYRYSVAASGFAQRFMGRLAQETFDRFGFGPGASVIEVGSGDGAQLAHFQQRGARVLGFEPSADLCAISRRDGVPVAECLFTADTVGEIADDLQPVDVVVLTYTFDHLPEPLPFLEAVRTVLEPARGVLVIEVHDLEQIMERRETCLFEHEHSVYLTSTSFGRLLARAGFALVTTELLPAAERRGNSLLVVAAPIGTEHAIDPPQPLSRDFDAWETYERFGAEAEQGHAALRDWVRARRAAGETVAGWGAGGRGVMTLAYTGLGPDDVSYLIDRNPYDQGHLAPGSHVPVVAPEHLDAEPVDHLIVFSYGYLDEIAAQVRDELQARPQLVSVLDLLRAPAGGAS